MIIYPVVERRKIGHLWCNFSLYPKHTVYRLYPKIFVSQEMGFLVYFEHTKNLLLE